MRHLLLREADAERLSPGMRAAVFLPPGQDLSDPIDERCGLLRRPAGLELGFEDLGPALDEPSQEREVLALGETLVAFGAQIVKRELPEIPEIAGTTDPIDAALAAGFGHGGDSTLR